MVVGVPGVVGDGVEDDGEGRRNRPSGVVGVDVAGGEVDGVGCAAVVQI